MTHVRRPRRPRRVSARRRRSARGPRPGLEGGPRRLARGVRRLLFPALHAAVDWSRGWTPVDAELQAPAPDAETGRRFADRVYRVHLKAGEDALLMVHVELQGQKDPTLLARLFTYLARLRDRHGAAVVSLVVLNDDDPSWRDATFAHELLGLAIRVEFPTAKLLDHDTPAGRAALEADPDPFAAVVLAHLESLRTHGRPAERLAAKRRVFPALRRRGLRRQDILELYTVVDFLLRLGPAAEREFFVEMSEEERRENVALISSAERIGHERGLAEGLEKGREEGLEKGREQALRALLLRFGPLPADVGPLLRRAAASERFEEHVQAAHAAPSLEAFLGGLRG